jgi:hypothetical protein
MNDRMWLHTFFSGDLKKYTYPDIECGALLSFLKRVSTQKRVCLIDVVNWQTRVPSTDYDIYIICSFGEFVNETLLTSIDTDERFKDKYVVFLTSQYWFQNRFENIKVFEIEHLHTITRFFNPTVTKDLVDRSHTHGLLSRRTAFHKSYTLVNLLERFPEDLLYTFVHAPDHEYKLETLDQDLDVFYPGIRLTEHQLSILRHLHTNPTSVDGLQWSVDNNIYQESKLMWAPESIFVSREYAPTAYLTEKTFKAIVSRSPFVLIGQQHSYTRLDELGFATYEDQFNINFDLQSDHDRFGSIINLMDTFDFDEFVSSKQTQEIADYNYNYFFNGFVDYVNKQSEEKIQAVLDYINEA